MNRRTLLKYAGSGIAAGAFAGSIGKVMASELSDASNYSANSGLKGKIPFSLIIDDGAPIDPLFYELPGYETPFLVPAKFTRRARAGSS
jgi:hypothetical protein